MALLNISLFIFFTMDMVECHVEHHSSLQGSFYSGPRKGHHVVGDEGDRVDSLDEFLPMAHSTFVHSAAHHEGGDHGHREGGDHVGHGHGLSSLSHPRLGNPVEAAAPPSMYTSPLVSERPDQRFSPFQPRFQIGRDEVSDVEWREVIEEALISHNLLAILENNVPDGLVNVNFGTHNCVHMGTHIEAADFAYEPTAISFPINSPNKLHTLLLIDVDSWPSHVHWLSVNIRGSRVNSGRTVAEYQSPMPKAGEDAHRYVFLVFEQTEELTRSQSRSFEASLCDQRSRNVALETLKDTLRLKRQAVAVNFFLGRHHSFVEGVRHYCKAS